MGGLIPRIAGVSGDGAGGSAVDSVFGRTGDVFAQIGDVDSTIVANLSAVTGATVTAALDKLKTDLAAVGAGISDWKQSVKTRTDTPPGSPSDGDRYLAGANPTGVWAGHANAIVDRTAGAWVFTAPTAGDAVNTEDTGHAWVYSGTTTSWNDMGATTVAPILSVYGRTGAITAQPGDYTATQITLTPTGNIAASTVQAGIAELDTEKQPVDATLTALAGVTTTADQVIYATGSDTFSVTALTAAGRSLIAAADAAAMRTTIGAASSGHDHAGVYQPADAELTALAGLTSASDKAPYFTGSGAAALMDVTSAARSVLDDTTTGAMLTTLGAAASGHNHSGVYQPVDPTLTAIAVVTTAADQLIYATGADAFATTALTAAGRALIDDADAAAMRTTLGTPQVTTQIATRYSITGGGDLSETRTLNLVNDAATPGANMQYGTDATGAKGWFAIGASGSGVTGSVETGTLTYTNATTTPTAIKAGGFPIDSAAWPQVGSQVTLEIVGLFSSGATTSRTIKADVTIGGQSAGTITSGTSSTNSSKPYKLTIVMRRSATGFAGSSTLETNGLVTGLTNFTTTQSVTGTITVAVNGYLGMTAGTGYQMTATAYSIDKTMAVSGVGAAQRMVATMAALRAIDPSASPALTNGELCYLQGFATPGDGGEGYFRWSATADHRNVASVSIATAGTGYTAGDIVTIGGTPTPCKVLIGSAPGGVPASVSILHAGLQSSDIAGNGVATSVYRATGSGLTLNVTTARSGDGGVIILPQPGGADLTTAGRWQRIGIAANEYSADWWGIARDGTDVTTALQSAIFFAGYRSLFMLSPGTYGVSATITLPEGMVLRGSLAPLATVILALSVTGFVLQTDSHDRAPYGHRYYTSIANIKVVGTATSGIWVRNTVYARLTDVDIGLDCNTTSGAQVFLTDSFQFTSRGLHLYGNAGAKYGLKVGPTCHSSSFYDTEIGGWLGVGIDINNDASVPSNENNLTIVFHKTTIQNSGLSGSGGTGIYIRAGNNIDFTTAYFEAVPHPIVIGNDEGDVGSFITFRNVSFDATPAAIGAACVQVNNGRKIFFQSCIWGGYATNDKIIHIWLYGQVRLRDCTAAAVMAPGGWDWRTSLFKAVDTIQARYWVDATADVTGGGPGGDIFPASYNATYPNRHVLREVIVTSGTPDTYQTLYTTWTPTDR